MRAICAAASILTTAACRWMQRRDPPLTQESRRNMWALNAAQIASLLLSNPHADFCCCGFFFVPQGTNKCCPLNSSRRWRALIDWRQSDAGRCWTKDDSDVRWRTDFYTSYCLIWRVTMKPWLFEFVEPWKVVVITDHLKAACIRLTSDNLGQVISCWLFRSL